MISVLEYIRPEGIDEALNRIGSGEYTPIAGGTDLVCQLRDGRPRKIIDLAGLGLDYIRDDGTAIEIGSMATHTDVAGDPQISKWLPALARASSMVGSNQIRNRGTIGGNIANASPCADTVSALLLYDSEVVLLSARGKRAVPISQFVTGPYQTSLKSGEIIHSIICKKEDPRAGWSYIKLGRRQAVNISRMTLAASIALNHDGAIESARISAGSVFPAPSRMESIENFITGHIPSRDLFSEAARLAADLMIEQSGRRWSTPYKEPVLIALLSRAIEKACNRASAEA
jgi:CO/xanthine dehydrogenase FAD-binding subunit